MTFDELLKFVESELRMSHVYQALLISFLVNLSETKISLFIIGVRQALLLLSGLTMRASDFNFADFIQRRISVTS